MHGNRIDIGIRSFVHCVGNIQAIPDILADNIINIIYLKKNLQVHYKPAPKAHGLVAPELLNHRSIPHISSPPGFLLNNGDAIVS
jgi:hypothetical protein